MVILKYGLPVPPVFTDGQTGSFRKGLVANLRQIGFSQTGQFHDRVAVKTVLQHGACNFEFSFIATFLPAQLDTLLNALLFKLLCDDHQFVLMLWHPLCQFAYKGLCV